MTSKYLARIVFFLSGISCLHSTEKLLILDTEQREEYFFHPFKTIAQSVGFEVFYWPIAQLMDNTIEELNLNTYDALFFFITQELLDSLPAFKIKQLTRALPSNLAKELPNKFSRLNLEKQTRILQGLHQKISRNQPTLRTFFKKKLDEIKNFDVAHYPATEKVLAILSDVSTRPHKLIGLLFPSSSTSIEQVNPFFEPFGFSTNDSMRALSKTVHSMQDLATFILLTNAFLAEPLEKKAFGYSTTLLPRKITRPTLSSLLFQAAQRGLPLISPLIKSPKITSTSNVAMLPIKDPLPINSFQARNTLPYGIYWFNTLHHNHLFIARQSPFHVASIAENIFFTPQDANFKRDILRIDQQILYELNLALNAKTAMPTDRIAKAKNLPLPKQPHNIGKPLQTFGPKKAMKCAWMEIKVFNNPTKKAEQAQLIDYIYQGGITHLWISLKPNIAYSPLGNSEQKSTMLASISEFTRQLLKKRTKYRTEVPKILIGFELNWNLYEPHMPNPSAHDLYGNTYYDFPSPLNRTFWENEVIVSLKKFLEDWQKYAISHGIPISGIMLDLEFYTRKTTGGFLSTMGFTKSLFQEVTGASLYPHSQRIRYMQDHNMTQQYFDVLFRESLMLGQHMYNMAHTLIPDCLIGCYMPTLNMHWFFKGFFQGLSTKEHPIILATFNSEFAQHNPWLKQQKIFAKHAGVLMLSHIRKPADFKVIDSILSHHDGIWLNRFSRLVEKYDPQELESSPLNKKEKTSFMRYLNR